MRNLNTFDIPLNTAVVTSTEVTDEDHPVLYVTHELDAAQHIVWQFYAEHIDTSPAATQLVGLGTMLDLDAGLDQVADLPLGWCARRETPAAPWQRHALG